MTFLSRRIQFASLSLTFVLFTSCANEILTGFEGDVSKPLDGISISSVLDMGEGPFPTEYCSETDGKYNSTIKVTRGDDSYDWALGGTCVTRPLKDVWAAFNHPALMRWPEAESYSAALGAPPAGVQILWNTHYHLSRFPVGSVDWDMSWFHTLLKGSPAEPRQVLISYAKVKGTSFVKRWQGSVLLEFVTPKITSITIKDTLSATSQNSSNCEATIRALIAHAQNQPTTPGMDTIEALPNQTTPVAQPPKAPEVPSPK